MIMKNIMKKMTMKNTSITITMNMNIITTTTMRTSTINIIMTKKMTMNTNIMTTMTMKKVTIMDTITIITMEKVKLRNMVLELLYITEENHLQKKNLKTG